MYIIPLCLTVENMRGTARLMHTASTTFMCGCVSTEKYSVLALFMQYEEMYTFFPSSENVGSHPYALTRVLRTGAMSTKPNVDTKLLILNFVRFAMSRSNSLSRTSCKGMDKASATASIAPADAPEISFICVNSSSYFMRL